MRFRIKALSTILPFLMLLPVLRAVTHSDSLPQTIHNRNYVLLAEGRPDGDVDENGNKNVFDLLELLKVLGGNSDVSEASDVNDNGETDIFDLLALLKVLSGWYDNPPGITVISDGNKVSAGDSLVAYNSATINISFSGIMDSSVVTVNGERAENDLEFDQLGIYLIEVRAFGNEQVSELALVCVVSEGYTITGRVLENDVEFPDVDTRITGATIDTVVSTHSDGSYSLSGLGNGVYTITPSKSSYSFFPVSLSVTVNGSDVTAIDISAFDIQGINMVSIPGGIFQMGKEGIAEPVHAVFVSSFQMSAHEVTNAQYAEYLNEALASGEITATSSSAKGAAGDYSGQEYINLSGDENWVNKCWIAFNGSTFSVEPDKEDWPVVYVTWYGARAFALKYGFDLPLEAEWELASCGGNQYEYGTNDGTLSKTNANYGKYTAHPVDVGSYPANPFGMYDLAGNLWEWCSDWYDMDYYSQSPSVNPTGPASGSSRTIRGGSWSNDTFICNSANRMAMNPGSNSSVCGFRVVLRGATPGDTTIVNEIRTGSLNINQSSTLQEDDLEVVTFSSAANVAQNGNFLVEANEADTYQMLMFRSKTTDNPVYLGLYNPSTQEMTASDTSTALALTLFNPYLIYSTQAQREQYLQAVRQNSKFSQLLSLLQEAYQTDANTALDYDSNPIIYQVAAQLMKEAMISIGGQTNVQLSSVSLGNPPYIEDASGENIKFVNPRHVWYAAGIYPNAGSLSEVVTINRKQTLVTVLAWPPFQLTDPEETEYKLGNGSFKIYLNKGGDFSKITQWNDPVGRATILNTGQIVLYTVELIIGHLPLPNFATLPNHINISAERAFQLSSDIAQRNVNGFLTHFFSLIADNDEAIAYWIYGQLQTNAAHEFIKTAASIFKRVTFVLELLGYVNEQGPFVWDLVFAPKEVTYFVTQTNGIISSTEQNEPPNAEFSINPPAGIIETSFNCDASATTDDIDNISDLEFRWDWQSDGNWDTEWSNNHTTAHSYSQAGSYSVTLEVRDSGGMTNSVVHRVNVGGGAGTATHVKLFRDNLPWDSNSMVTMLESIGFAQGTGPNTYEIISSDQMSSAALVPGADLVIISNDQNQTFYNNYAASQVRFNNFVYMGGSMLWEACDKGWAEGSLANAGVILPGNLTTTIDYDDWNYVTDQNLPLVTGLPDAMDHNYASHESFSNVPDGTTVYCINEESEPTLIEFNLGGGWIIITGQPLEHQYENVVGAADMEELLPRIVSYFTGTTYNKSLLASTKADLKKSTRPTHE